MKKREPEKNPSLPTGKSVISFSELVDHVECSFRHKLKHIDKIDKFEENVNTNFGTALHDSCEHYLKNREMRYEIALDYIIEAWEKFNLPNMGDWMIQANAILEAVPGFLDTRFPGWECFDAEERLEESIEEHKDVRFKGYIDGIIKHDGLYWIIDWKTSTKGWNDYKKKDEKLKMQLILYSEYWGNKHNIPLEKIRVGFAVMNRDLKNPERIEFFTFDVDKKRQKKTLNVLNNSISMIKSRKHFKEWKNKKFPGSCRFCDYDGTKHCP